MRTDRVTDLEIAAAVLLATWTLLASAPLFAARVGASTATTLVFAAATALAYTAGRRTCAASGWRRFALGAASGFASYPAWVAFVAVIGLGTGMLPRSGGPPTPWALLDWLPILVLAPLFEELLYRGLVLPALRRRLGALPAVVVTSALFAAPHLEPWQMLGTFCIGLALGSVFVVTGDVWLCVALHAGLNLAGLVCGAPPVRWALDPGAAAIVGPILLALALVRVTRIGADRSLRGRAGHA